MRLSIRLLALCAAFALTGVPAANAATTTRTFGAYVDPWHVAEWTAKVGAAPRYVARFEAFSRGSTVDEFLRESEHEGLVNKFPFDVEKKDYPYWDGLLGRPVEMVYDDTETILGL